jgi:hypothetical protein
LKILTTFERGTPNESTSAAIASLATAMDRAPQYVASRRPRVDGTPAVCSVVTNGTPKRAWAARTYGVVMG